MSWLRLGIVLRRRSPVTGGTTASRCLVLVLSIATAPSFFVDLLASVTELPVWRDLYYIPS